MRAFLHHTEGINVVNLLPLNGNTDENLMGAEAVYPTRNHGVFGLSLFKDQQGKPYTNHMVILGKTGYGKSVTSLDLASQVQCHCDVIFIVESGGSWSGFVSTFGKEGKSLVIDPNGNSTINYLGDTGELPLSPQHLNDVIGIMSLMIGRSQSEDVNQFRGAKLTDLLWSFYEEYLQQWARHNTARCRTALEEFQKMKLLIEQGEIDEENVSDQFVKMKEWAAAFPTKFSKLPADARSLPTELDQICFLYAFLRPEEAPTHSDFHSWLSARLKKGTSVSKEDQLMLYNLGSWKAERGNRGKLFDGISTFNFNGSAIHVELGLIPNTDKLLKRLAGYIVACYIRNKITRMSRDTKKLVIFEELGSFLSFSGSEHIIADFFERGRKYQACVITIVQQLSRIPPELQSCILNNASLGMFFRQQGQVNASAVQEGFQLPDSTALELTRLPSPTPENGASFISWQAGEDAPLIHYAYCLAPHELLEVAKGNAGSVV